MMIFRLKLKKIFFCRFKVVFSTNTNVCKICSFVRNFLNQLNKKVFCERTNKSSHVRKICANNFVRLFDRMFAKFIENSYKQNFASKRTFVRSLTTLIQSVSPTWKYDQLRKFENQVSDIFYLESVRSYWKNLNCKKKFLFQSCHHQLVSSIICDME